MVNNEKTSEAINADVYCRLAAGGDCIPTQKWAIASQQVLNRLTVDWRHPQKSQQNKGRERKERERERHTEKETKAQREDTEHTRERCGASAGAKAVGGAWARAEPERTAEHVREQKP